MPADIRIALDLTEEEAMALAQWCKRYTWDDLHSRSAGNAEHNFMEDAFLKLRRALAEKGFAPR